MEFFAFISIVATVCYAPTVYQATYGAIVRKYRLYDYSPQRSGLIHVSKISYYWHGEGGYASWTK